MPNPDFACTSQANYHYIDSSGAPQKTKVATSMTATFDAGALNAGQKAQECEDAGINAATSRLNALYGARSYVRGHLLNNWLGGKANGENLFPFSKRLNNHHKNQVETNVKDIITGNPNCTSYGKVSRSNGYVYKVSINPSQTDYASENMTDSSGVVHNYTNVSLDCDMNGTSKTVT